MNGSARLMMGTKQFQGWPPASGEGTQPTVWMTATSSGETMISLVPMAFLKFQIAVATVLGEALQLSISKSTPSRLYLLSMPARVEMNLSVLAVVANTNPQLPFWPPTEISTFFPLACQDYTRAVGKLASSTRTVPSAWGLAKARITNLTLGLTSSAVDCPQQSCPNPQQKIETGVVEWTTANRSRKASISFIYYLLCQPMARNITSNALE